MRGLCAVCRVCGIASEREADREGESGRARAGEYKCDYLAVREVRGVF